MLYPFSEPNQDQWCFQGLGSRMCRVRRCPLDRASQWLRQVMIEMMGRWWTMDYFRLLLIQYGWPFITHSIWMTDDDVRMIMDDCGINDIAMTCPKPIETCRDSSISTSYVILVSWMKCHLQLQQEKRSKLDRINQTCGMENSFWTSTWMTIVRIFSSHTSSIE